MFSLRTVGFFQETCTDMKERPSLRACIADTPQPDEDKIIAYLENGAGYSGCGEYLPDVLDPNSGPKLLAGSLTDGVFLWPDSLAYYVAKYHARLPDDFVTHMKINNWIAPTEDSIDFDQLGAD